jgi:hypothetical protein
MKTRFILMLIASGMLFFSCQENEGARPSGTFAGNEPGAAAATGYAVRIATSFMVIQGTDTEDEATTVVWGGEMSLGEQVATGGTRRMTWNNNVFDFIEVRLANGREGFAFINQVIPGGRLAVVVEENTSLARSERPVDISGVTLARQAVVVYFPETEISGLVRVRGWDQVRGANVTVDNNHVRLAALSTRDSDIQSSIMLQTALSLPEGNARREALLRGALDNFMDSVFFTEIFEIVYPGQAFGAVDVFEPVVFYIPETPAADDDFEFDLFGFQDVDIDQLQQ